jgi:hypothetical protein
MDKPIPGAQHMTAWFCRSDFVLFGSSRASSAVPTVRTWLQILVAGGVGNHQLKQSRVPNFGRRIDGNSDRSDHSSIGLIRKSLRSSARFASTVLCWLMLK